MIAVRVVDLSRSDERYETSSASATKQQRRCKFIEKKNGFGKELKDFLGQVWLESNGRWLCYTTSKPDASKGNFDTSLSHQVFWFFDFWQTMRIHWIWWTVINLAVGGTAILHQSVIKAVFRIVSCKLTSNIITVDEIIMKFAISALARKRYLLRTKAVWKLKS